MQTRVYADGFNLYYGALRRWQIAPMNKKDRQIIESSGVEMP